MLSLFLFAFITSITPGPNNSMLMASGIRFGVRRSLPHLFGINIGFGFMFLIVGLVLPLVPESLIAFLEYVALGLILYIAFKIATASTDVANADSEDVPWTFLQAAAFQWINPKALIMAFAGSTSYGLDTVTAAAIFTATNAVCGVWIFAGVWMRRFLIGNPQRTRVIYLCLAGTMVATLFV